MKYPTDLYYTSEHLWLKRDAADNTWFAGITDYAQDLLGDIVYLELPPIGLEIHAAKPCGLVESVKTGSDLHAPLNGTVVSVNEALKDNPEEINETPYKSWIFSFRASEPVDETRLLSSTSYQALITAK